jgi:hypothetical protein
MRDEARHDWIGWLLVGVVVAVACIPIAAVAFGVLFNWP